MASPLCLASNTLFFLEHLLWSAYIAKFSVKSNKPSLPYAIFVVIVGLANFLVEHKPDTISADFYENFGKLFALATFIMLYRAWYLEYSTVKDEYKSRIKIAIATFTLGVLTTGITKQPGLPPDDYEGQLKVFNTWQYHLGHRYMHYSAVPVMYLISYAFPKKTMTDQKKSI